MTSISEQAFFNCSGLTSVTLLEGVTCIGDYAFRYCDGIREVHAASLEHWLSIDFGYSGSPMSNGGAKLFLNGVELSGTLTIPESVTGIPAYGFENCSGITGVVIHESVTSIGDGAFDDCDGIREVHVASLEQWLLMDFGWYNSPLCNGSAKLYLNGEEMSGTVTIPESVTDIPEHAFANCSGITGVVLHEGVTGIGDYAFNDCTGLTRLAIPESVTSIGDRAFYHCTGLTSLIISEGLTSIGIIAFSDCDGLTSVALPKSLREISYGAFSDCDKLASVTINSEQLSLHNTAFQNCPVLENLTVPAWMVSDGNAIADMFGADNDLKGITVADGCTAVSEAAFAGCSKLASVVLPDSVTSIGDSAFSGCSVLGGMVLPAGVTAIGPSTFAGCSAMKSIELPDALTSIDATAFTGCDALEYIIIRGSAEPQYDLSAVPGEFTVVCVEYGMADIWALKHGYPTSYLPSTEEVLEFSLECPVTELEIGKTCVITPVIVPVQKNPVILWSSSAPEVASVENGVVKGIAPGMVTITAVCGNAQASVELEVYEPLNGLVCSWYGGLYLVSKEVAVVEVLASPMNAKYNLTFSIADDRHADIIAVEEIERGYRLSIQGYFVGETELCCSDSYTGWSFVYPVVVCYPPTSVTMEKTEVEVLSWHSTKLDVTVTTRDNTYTNRLVTFDTTDRWVAVHEYDMLHARTPGTVTITATTSNGLSASCVVTVRDPVVSALPAGLTEIGDSAFMGTAAECYSLPDGVKRIGSRAFADCPNLREIRIPASVTSIADDAFAGCQDLIIMCPYESTAWQYGSDHGIPVNNYRYMD